MKDIFLYLFNMSITAGWLALAVMLFRVLFQKAPKSLTVVLWAFVGVRLLFPVSVESVLSLIPSRETVPTDIMYAETPTIHTGLPHVNTIVNPILSETLAPAPSDSVNPMQTVTSIACTVWLVGMAAMLAYTAFSYLRLHLKVREASPLEQNVYLCDHIDTPFLLGIVKPRIYLPSAINQSDIPYVLAHERAHIKRRDYLWKPLGFLLLTVYWFNPVLWLAYVLLCRDIETACDEKVLATHGSEIKKPYANALINCSIKRQTVAACPLAFGEVSVAHRVKSVLHYKKPAVWLIALAVIASIVIAVCFLTDPPSTPSDEPIQIKQHDMFHAVHKPEDGGSESFGVNGSMLEQYLSETDWQPVDAPASELDETGSVTFWTEGFSKEIKVFAKKDGDAFAYAVVTQYSTTSQDKQTTHYRASDSDYQKAVLLLRRRYSDAERIPYRDGTTFFYTNAVSEREAVKPQALRYVDFEPKTFERLIAELAKQNWIDDYLHEREEFFFDGRISYGGNWLYFGFEQKVVYCGRHYCTVSDGILRMLREVHDAPDRSDELMQRYPLLFGLDVSKGLTVHCGQMAPSSFSWSVLPNACAEQFFFVSSPLGCKREDLLLILERYGLTRGEVEVEYKSILVSSYAPMIPQEYSDDYDRFLEALFWGDANEWGIGTELQAVCDGELTLLLKTMVTDRMLSETLTVSPRYSVLTMENGTATATKTFEATQKTLSPNETYTLRYDLGELPHGDYTLVLTVVSERYGRQEERAYHIPFTIE